METAYFSLNKEEFDKKKKNALLDNIEEYGEDDHKDCPSFLWENIPTTLENYEFKDGVITASFNLDSLAFLSVKIPLDLDNVSEIIEYYIKKVNKVKNVIESVK